MLIWELQTHWIGHIDGQDDIAGKCCSSIYRKYNKHYFRLNMIVAHDGTDQPFRWVIIIRGDSDGQHSVESLMAIWTEFVRIDVQ